MDGDPVLGWLVFYKIAALAVGCFFCLIGYRLYARGHTSGSGDVNFAYGSWSVSFLRAAPGMIFMFVGGVIVVATIWRGISVDRAPQTFYQEPTALPSTLNYNPPAQTYSPEDGQSEPSTSGENAPQGEPAELPSTLNINP